MTLEEMKKKKTELGLTSEMISQLSGVPLGTVQKIFAGTTKAPRRLTIEALEKVLDRSDEASQAFPAAQGRRYTLDDYYALPDEKIEGLDVLDIYTEHGSPRLIGNIVLQSDEIGQPIVGFENHGGRTHIGSHTPLGKVVKGFGNTGDTGAEGVRYKNVFATYLHGPLLPKNPQLCDIILTKALKKKYPDFSTLSELDDAMENTANEYMKKMITE